MRATADRPPWSPLSVTIITIFLPTGGIVLTVRNMQRLGVLDQAEAWRMTAGAILISGVGLGIIFGLAPKDSHGLPMVDVRASYIISFAAAFLSYLAQREPYRRWRAGNSEVRSSPGYKAVGMAVLFALLAGIVSAPVWLISQAVAHGSVGALSG